MTVLAFYRKSPAKNALLHKAEVVGGKRALFGKETFYFGGHGKGGYIGQTVYSYSPTVAL